MSSAPFQQLVFERRSTRGYEPDRVPRELLDEIIEVAAQSPSSMNTQPWNVHIVTGDVMDRIRQGNTERMISTGEPDREIGFPDDTFAANDVVSERRPVADIATYRGFDDG